MNAQREAAAAATATLTMAASQTTKRKVKDKTPVMEGQTEEERRILRQEQRTLYDRIGDRNVDLQDLDHDAFDEERNNNNNLFKKVRFNREVRRRAARPAGPPAAMPPCVEKIELPPAAARLPGPDMGGEPSSATELRLEAQRL